MRIFLSLYVLLAAGFVSARNPQDSPKIETRRISWSYEIENRSNKTVSGAHLWTYAPVPKTDAQRRVGLDASRPFELLDDGSGNQIMRFSFDKIAPYATALLKIRATVELALPEKSAKEKTSTADLSDYLVPEPLIESDAKEIVKLAKFLRTPKNYFSWVSSEIKRKSFSLEDRGAALALKMKAGDCTDSAYLFAALCRAKGVPARVVGGYVCQRDMVLRPDQYHNWAEFQSDGRWALADPQRKVFDKGYRGYVTMNILSPKTADSPMKGFQRFRFEGENLRVRMTGR